MCSSDPRHITRRFVNSFASTFPAEDPLRRTAKVCRISVLWWFSALNYNIKETVTPRGQTTATPNEINGIVDDHVQEDWR